MNIAVDIRALNESHLAGVGEYTFHLLSSLFILDRRNHYVLFTNAWKRFPNRFGKLPGNVSSVSFSYPNKAFNVSLRFLRHPMIDRLIEQKMKDKIDLFLIPNLNFLSVRRECPKVVIIHDLSFELFPQFFSFKRRLWHRLVEPRRLAEEASRIIAISENTKQDLMDFYKVPEEKITVIYPGVNDFNFKRFDLPGRSNLQILRNKYNLPEHFILYLGTLEPRKNIEGLIQAFELFSQRYKLKAISYKLVLAGQSGWLTSSIYQAAKQSPVKDRIQFIGYVEEDDKPALLSLASLFVYPSFYEGFGFPPLEAAREGVPTIVSASSSFFETLGEGSILVNPWNIKEIAEAMFQVLTDEELRKELVEKGKAAVERFSWEKCARETLKVFEEVDSKVHKVAGS